MRISDWSSDVCSSDLPSGYIVTNHHVIADADEVEVVLSDGTSLDATIVGSDKDTDLALLKVDAKMPLPSTTWGDSDATRIGDWVVAIGNPFGLGGTVTPGIVPARPTDLHAGPYDPHLPPHPPPTQTTSPRP